MSFAKIYRNAWKKPKLSVPAYKEKVRHWRRQDAIVRIEKPTNPVRAHALGYKAKLGYIIIRGRIRKGGRRRPKPDKGRNPGKMGLVHFTPSKSRQTIMEQRVAKKYRNMEVLNSYEIADDGQYHYYEIILVDPLLNKNAVRKGSGRAQRGLTSSARKSRMSLHEKA